MNPSCKKAVVYAEYAKHVNECNSEGNQQKKREEKQAEKEV